jgi:hypothetical protein
MAVIPGATHSGTVRPGKSGGALAGCPAAAEEEAAGTAATVSAHRRYFK